MSDVSRRSFLAAAGALVVALPMPRNARAEVGSGFGPFLAVTPDDHVIVFSPSSEMGQGITTTLAMIVAEELDADWSRVRVEHAPAGRPYRRRVGPGTYSQLTGGSTSTAWWHEPLRQAGCEARARLVAAAAARFGVDASVCVVENGVVHVGERRARFGELATAAAALPRQRAEPKPRAAYRLRGTNVRRLDLRSKVDGSAQFGADVRVPGLKFASTQASPAFGGRVGSVDDTAARAIPGVRDVLSFDRFVAVVADHSWAAQKGLEALDIRWIPGPGVPTSTERMRKARLDALSPGAKARTVERGKPLEEGAPGVVGGVYEVPYLEHLCMSPLNATARVTEDACDIWIPTQAQTLVERAARRITGLPSKAIRVHTTQLGGGFGRRGYTDEVEQTLRIAMAVGAPVQVQWTREETTRQGRYRPASAARFLGRIGAGGAVEAVHARVARQSEFDFFVPDFAEGWKLAARFMAEGLSPMPYRFDSYRLDMARLESPVPVGFWRSVGHSGNAFFVESFVDELAAAAGEDPFRFRERLLQGHERHLGVLRRAVAEAGEAPLGRFHGVAVHEAYESFCAQVVEISMEASWPRVHRVVCALDCGEVLHPDGARAQVSGATIFGLSAALYGRIDFDDGRVVQGNFHDAPIVRMHEAPEVEVHFVESNAPPTGVGELGTPPLAPALCNAIFAATGRRIRTLPLSESLEQA